MSEIEKKLWKRVERFVPLLKICPFLRMVAVCNNLAFGSVDERSDIDIFVVAREGRLFTVRIFVTLLLHLFGVRRHDNKVAGRFCLSFFIDDSHLDLSSIALENDIYLAYWLKSMKPVIDDGVSVDLVAKNAWARRFFEDVSAFEIDTGRVVRRRSFAATLLEKLLSNRFGNFIEKRLKDWQLKRAGKKAVIASEGSSLLVEEHILKFHNIDRRREYRSAWIKAYGSNVKVNAASFLALFPRA